MSDSMVDNSDLVGDESPTTTEILPPSKDLTFSEQIFCYKFVEMGRNAKRAALAAGYSQANGTWLLRRPDIRAFIVELVEPTLRKTKLEVEEMLGQIHAVATFDRRKLYNADGSRKSFTELDAKTAAAISHMGPNDFQPFNKMQAIDMAMKHLGGFEKDNDQRRDNLSISVTLV